VPSGSLPAAGRSAGWARVALATLGALALSSLCVTAAFWPTETGGPRTRRIPLPAELVACAVDADCVVVDRIGCCTCSTGGAQWAVNVSQVDALRRFLKHSCKNRPACLQINACRRDLTAVCRAATCTVEVGPAEVDEPARG
jgi:hypothetical protein